MLDNFATVFVVSSTPPLNSSPKAIFKTFTASVNFSTPSSPVTPKRPASIEIFNKSCNVVDVSRFFNPVVNRSTASEFNPVVLRTLA